MPHATCSQSLRLYTFHSHAEKNSSIGCRNWEYGGRYSAIKRGLLAKPLLDQSGLVEFIILNDNVGELFWFLFLWKGDDIFELVKEY